MGGAAFSVSPCCSAELRSRVTEIRWSRNPHPREGKGPGPLQLAARRVRLPRRDTRPHVGPRPEAAARHTVLGPPEHQRAPPRRAGEPSPCVAGQARPADGCPVSADPARVPNDLVRPIRSSCQMIWFAAHAGVRLPDRLSVKPPQALRQPSVSSGSATTRPCRTARPPSDGLAGLFCPPAAPACRLVRRDGHRDGTSGVRPCRCRQEQGARVGRRARYRLAPAVDAGPHGGLLMRCRPRRHIQQHVRRGVIGPVAHPRWRTPRDRTYGQGGHP